MAVDAVVSKVDWVGGRLRRSGFAWLPVIPFFGYVGVFLLLPTVIVIIDAFSGRGGFTLSNIKVLATPYVLNAFWHSVIVAATSSAIGAVAGGFLAYLISTAPHNGILRRALSSASGVLALFGGVSLAFAFIATLGGAGFVTTWLGAHGIEIYSHGVWLYELPGLILVYVYFQIPLMVLIFLPALDGLQVQWREAAESLGCSTVTYWWHIGIPLLRPAFLGATLLLFANAFSAFATVAALITQGGIVVPLQIANALSSEVGGGPEHLAQALALAMIAVVIVIMMMYALLQRQANRWLQ